jgi:hypothetical protein
MKPAERRWEEMKGNWRRRGGEKKKLLYLGGWINVLSLAKTWITWRMLEYRDQQRG